MKSAPISIKIKMTVAHGIKSGFAPNFSPELWHLDLAKSRCQPLPLMRQYSGETHKITESRFPDVELYPLTLFVASNAVVHERGVVSAGNNLILETISPGLISEQIDYEEAITNPEPYYLSSNPCEPTQAEDKIKRLPDNCNYCLIATNYSYNFAHWHMETLASIHIIKEHLANCKAVVHPLNDWQKESLILAGLAEQDIIEIQDFPIFIPRLIVPSTTWTYYTDVYRLLPFYKDIFECIIVSARKLEPITNSPKKVYITRLISGHRKILNESEVVSVFESFGFVAIAPEEVSYAYLAQVFREADIIAGLSGAALARIGFCKPSIKFIELSIAGGWQSGWHTMAAMFDITDHIVYIEKDANLNFQVPLNPQLTRPQQLDSWTIDIDALKIFLEFALARSTTST